jgi:hypothetical protein
MNQDFKIRRENIDADVRSLHGQVAQIESGNSRAECATMKMCSAETSQFSARMTQLGLVEEVQMSLPSSWQSSPSIKSVKDQLEAFKAAKEETKPSFSSMIGKLFSKDKEKTLTGLQP